MKLDETRGLLDGSSIAEEASTTRSVSRFTDTTDATNIFEKESNFYSRKLSMDTEDNLPLTSQAYTDFAKTGVTPKVQVHPNEYLEQGRSGKRS